MKKILCAALVFAGLALPRPAAWAGGTPTPPPSELLQMASAGSGVSNGDYVSNQAAPALDAPYRFFVEVPPGTANLDIQFFDADVGVAGGSFDLNLSGGGAFTASVAYSIFDPTGALVAGPAVLGPGVCGGCDNAWVQFPTFPGPLAGHWEVRVDMSSAVTTGSDVNSFGVRAHDGDPTAGGVELNVYGESFLPLGTLGNPSSTTTSVFPYVSSGCEIDSNDFDGDAPQAGSALNYSSRTGAFSQSVGISGPTVWLNQTISGWTTDSASLDYGIWSSSHVVTAVTPGLGANVITLWNGAFDAADPPTGGLGPPPTAQPENGALRLYLPRDGGGAPTKPYLEQELTHVGGPNPPVAGALSQFRVTVRLVNPTPHVVAFAAPARLVRAEVPGGAVAYAGDPLLSQGSLLAQPALGGSGGIEWNPGALAAGDTALLAYRVNVTPPAPGSRVVVTGTPGSLGTTATFLDETGRAAQPRAIYTFGPLCELAVTAGLATHATLARVRAALDPAGGGVVLEWQTRSEVATVGFDVYRHSLDDRGAETGPPRRVGDRRHVGLLSAPQGGVYRLLDPEAPDEGAFSGARYSIVEIDRSGARQTHGPFDLEVEQGLEPPAAGPRKNRAFESARRRGPALLEAGLLKLDLLEPEAVSAAAWAASPEALRELESRSLEALSPSVDPETSLARSARVKILASERGPTWTSAADLAGASTLELAEVRRLLASHGAALTHRGLPVAWRPERDGLLFFATRSESLLTRDSVYMLELGARGVPFASASSGVGGARPAPPSFPARRQIEQDVFAATAFGPRPESDYWFWKTVVSGHPTLGVQSFELAAPGLAAGSSTLEVLLQSAVTSGVRGEHRARVRLQGVELGVAEWSGIATHSAVFEVPSGLLRQAGNALEIEGELPDGVSFSGYFIDGFELRYPRSYRLEEGSLEVSGVEGEVRVAVPRRTAVSVYEILEVHRPSRVEDARVVVTGAAAEVRFTARPGARYWVGTAEAASAPREIRPVAPFALSGRQAGADYLVIAHRSLEAAARGLVERSAARGRTGRVIGVERVYDEFAHGFPDPLAIRALLRRAQQGWAQPPRYVALVGSGSFDYRNLLGSGLPLLPPPMVLTRGGLFASDQPLADLDGDGAPDLALGRIPASSAAELEAYVAKLEAYEESSPVDWQNRWLRIADRPSGGGDFAADSADLAGALPAGIETIEIAMGSQALPDVQGELLDAWRRGAGVVHYFGHGGLDRLSGEGLLTTAEAAGLDQAPRLPVVFALTCAVNRFALPGFRSLGETLVLDADGGAAAVFSATGLSEHPEARVLSRFLERSLSGDRASPLDPAVATGDPAGRVLGDEIVRALGRYLESGGRRELLRVYSLLGDPLTSRPPGAAPADPPPASGSS
ncbi:MAG: C25 family cysteine peptidase [Acidobacteriota bacterium]